MKPLTQNDLNSVPIIKVSSTPTDEDIINKGKAKNFLSTPKKSSSAKRRIQAAKVYILLLESVRFNLKRRKSRNITICVSTQIKDICILVAIIHSR